MNRTTWIGLVAAAGLVLSGCGKADKVDGDHDGHDHSDHDHAPKKKDAPPSPELAKVVLPSGAPETFVGVAAAKKDSKDGDTVVVGGRVKDFVDGKAVFTVMDGSVPSCRDNPGDKCETPWDYCCEPVAKITANSATIQIVGDGTEPLSGNLKGVSNIDHLTSVVVEGKAIRDAAGNLIVQATKVYIK